MHGRGAVRGTVHLRGGGAGTAAVSGRRHGPGHGQRPAGGVGSALSAHRRRQLCVQRRQLRVCWDAAQHGKTHHGHDDFRRVHAAEHPLELHPDFWKIRRACLGHYRGGSGHTGLPDRGVPHYSGLRPVQPPCAPAACRHSAARRRYLAGFCQILRPRSGERDAVGPWRQRDDRHHGPHGHQRRDAGGLRRYGQH